VRIKSIEKPKKLYLREQKACAIIKNIMKSFKKYLNNFKKQLNTFLKKYLSKKTQQKIKENLQIGKKFIQSKAFFVGFLVICVYLLGVFLTKYVLNLQFGSWEKAETFLSENKEIAAFSATVTILLSFLFVGIFRNWRIAMGVLYSFATIIMYINTEKMASRNTPFLPEDLAMSSEADGLASMINFGRFSNMIFTVGFIIIITIIANKISKKIWNFNLSKKWKLVIFIPQIVLVLTCFYLLDLHTLEIRNLSGKGTFIKVEKLKTSVDLTDQAYNYQTNGYILGTISNLQEKTQKEPEGYSKEAIQKIVKKYQAIAEERNKDRNKLNDEKVNVVYVMSESFIDPALAKHIYDYGNKEPIPYTKKILKSKSHTVTDSGANAATPADLKGSKPTLNANMQRLSQTSRVTATNSTCVRWRAPAAAGRV